MWFGGGRRPRLEKTEEDGTEPQNGRAIFCGNLHMPIIWFDELGTLGLRVSDSFGARVDVRVMVSKLLGSD